MIIIMLASFIVLCLSSLSLSVLGSLSRIGLKQTDTNGSRVFYELETRGEIIFHGVNAIVKGFPWVPSTNDFDINTSLVDKDHSMLADLGVNMYRLGAMWPGGKHNINKY